MFNKSGRVSEQSVPGRIGLRLVHPRIYRT
jgi:hypothetical protein